MESNFKYGTQAEEGQEIIRVAPGIGNKIDLISFYISAGFPEYLRNSWDSLFDLMCYLFWIDRVEVNLFHEDLPLINSQEECAKYISVLNDAVADWRRSPEHKLIVTFPEVYRDIVESLRCPG